MIRNRINTTLWGIQKRVLDTIFIILMNKKCLHVSRHATFLEREFILEMASGSQIELDEVREPQSRKEKEVEQELIPHDDVIELTTQDT